MNKSPTSDRITRLPSGIWMTDTGATARSRDEALIMVGRQEAWQQSVWSAMRALEIAGLDAEQVAAVLHHLYGDQLDLVATLLESAERLEIAHALTLLRGRGACAGEDDLDGDVEGVGRCRGSG